MEQPNQIDCETTCDNLQKQDQLQASNESISEGSMYGKFRDAKSLLDAYNTLQAEFTRKCQKLAEFQKTQNVNVESENNVQNKQKNEDAVTNLGQNDVLSQNDLGNEKVSENKFSDMSSKEFDTQVKNFFANNSDAKIYAERMGEILLDNPDMQSLHNAVDLAYKLAKSEQLKSPNELVDDEKFLDEYIYNSPKITSKIMNTVLEKAKGVYTPKLMTGVLGSSASFNTKTPTSLNDAKEYILKKLEDK